MPAANSGIHVVANVDLVAVFVLFGHYAERVRNLMSPNFLYRWANSDYSEGLVWFGGILYDNYEDSDLYSCI
jgi:hypothetical protein